MKKKFSKVLLVLFMVVFVGSTMVFGLSSCSFAPQENINPGGSEEVNDGPTVTSAEMNLYAYGLAVCDRNGVESTLHHVDDSGNIVDADGKIVVAASYVEGFTVSTSAELISEQTYSLDGERVSEDIVLVTPVTVPIELVITPDNVTNDTVTIESVDENDFVFTSAESDNVTVVQKNGADAAVKVSTNPGAGGKIVLHAFCETAGEHIVRVRNVVGDVIGEYTFVFEVNVTERADEGGKDEHVHDYEDTVVEPTVTSRGYTKHTCKICGASYVDSYTDILPHTHDYEDKVVAPTYTEKGYTLHTCKICGHTYKDNYTAVLVCNHDHMKDTVVKPTCTEGGYTLHECLVCKNYSYRDKETPATGHKWDDGKITTNPTCTKEGVKTYTCSVCGEKKTEKVAKIPHEYETKVVEPTYTEKGYTLHTCKMCGHSYKDNYTDIKPHQHSYTTRVVAPTCTEKGYTEHKCSTCGDVYKTDEKPALGHNYKDTVVEPTQTDKGYTHHECTRCGHSYDDNYTDPLPAWSGVSASAASAAGNAWLSSNGYAVNGACIGGSSTVFVTIDPLDYEMSQSGLNQYVISLAASAAPVAVARANEAGYTAMVYCYVEDRGDGNMFIAIYWGCDQYIGE